MDPRHARLLGASADDADARGEHVYPDSPDTPQQDGSVEEEAVVRRRTQYVAGADGTQEIPEPEDAVPPGR